MNETMTLTRKPLTASNKFNLVTSALIFLYAVIVLAAIDSLKNLFSWDGYSALADMSEEELTFYMIFAFVICLSAIVCTVISAVKMKNSNDFAVKNINTWALALNVIAIICCISIISLHAKLIAAILNSDNAYGLMDYLYYGFPSSNGVVFALIISVIAAVLIYVRPNVESLGTASGEVITKVKENVSETVTLIQKANNADKPSKDVSKVENDLRKLKTLVDEGLITEEDYEAKKRQLLNI